MGSIFLAIVCLSGFQVFPESSTGTIAGPVLREPEDPEITADGLNYDYYEGAWSMLPDFTGLSARKLGNVVNVDLAPRNRETDYAFRFTGFIEVPTDGVYTFYTTSDDGSRLQIGTTTVVDNDGIHDAAEASGTIGLKHGKHAITISVFQHLSASIFFMSYEGPGMEKQLIPAQALFRSGDPVASWRLEAERGFLSGATVFNNNGGYTGSGFVDFNVSGDYIKWVATTPQYGVYQLTFRYALDDDPSAMRLNVNGSMDSTLTFPSTDSWSSWATITLTTVLNEGANTILLIASGQSSPNIDNLILGYRGVTTVVVGTEPAIVNETGINKVVPYPNPSGGKVYIDWQTQHAGPLQLELINGNGNVVKTERFNGVGQGANTFMLDAEGVGDGVYWIRVKQGAVSKVAAVMVRK
jgi:hypothetical protein